MELVQIYLTILNKIIIISNFLVFFLLLLFSFSLLHPDPGGKMNADPKCTALGPCPLQEYCIIVIYFVVLTELTRG